MSWKRKKRTVSKYEQYSISKDLRAKGLSNDEFETMMSQLSLEDLIALKMELSVRPANNRLYSIPLWKTLPTIVQEAIFKFAYSCTRSQREAMAFLGLEAVRFYKLRKRFGLDRLFEK
jgi:hypothetical protein